MTAYRYLQEPKYVWDENSQKSKWVTKKQDGWFLYQTSHISIDELEEKIANYRKNNNSNNTNVKNGGGKKKTQRRKSKPKKKNPKIYTGKRGGKYYLKNGHKIYI